MSARLGVVVGLLLAAAVGTWWVAATRIAIEQSADTAALATQAIFVFAIARAALSALLGGRTGAAAGFKSAMYAAIPVVVVAWPLVTLAWLASSTAASHVLGIELALLAVGVLGSALGHAARRALHPAMPR